MANTSITVGRLLCGTVRGYLDKCKFKGMDVDYIESGGWIEREFVIKGSNEDIIKIHAALKAWGSDD